jgi:uncharacterized protein with HEPN domain
MSKRSLGLLVEDIWESIEKIERYTEGMTRDKFQSDEKTTDAVVRNLEIIGEEQLGVCRKISPTAIQRSNG